MANLGGILRRVAGMVEDAAPVVTRGIGDNGGPSMFGATPAPYAGQAYSRSGENISRGLLDVPTSRLIARGVDDLPAGSGFTKATGVATRQSTLPTHTSEGYMSPELSAPLSFNSISPLRGYNVFPIVGDNTGRHTVTGVQGQRLESPIDIQAGFQYTDVGSQGYAGAPSATHRTFRAAEDVENSYMMSLLMGEQSGDFSLPMGNLYGEMAKLAEIPSANVSRIDDIIRNIPMTEKYTKPDGSNGSRTIRPFADFPSVADPSAIQNYVLSLPTGGHRAAFMKGLDAQTLVRLGLPRVSDARLAAADLNLIGLDWGSTGYRGIIPDIGRGTYQTLPEQSATYTQGYDKVGPSHTFTENSGGIPANLFFRDAAQMMRDRGTGGGLEMNSATYKVYEASPRGSMQYIDDMAIETVDTFLEMERRFGREAALQYANQLLSGGHITGQMIDAARRANAPNWLIAAMAPSAGIMGAAIGGQGNNRSGM